MLNKSKILAHIITELEDRHRKAVSATQQAHETATHKENIAENKYDTLGLEAGYLAFGQAQRVAEFTSDLETWKALKPPTINDKGPIKVGSLVSLLDDQDKTMRVFLGPAAGGLKFELDGEQIIVVTPTAPLGKALLGNYLDDECQVAAGDKVIYYTIERIM